MQHIFSFLLFLLLAGCPYLAALPFGPHVVSIGPEFYHLKRERKNKGTQDGWLYGGHLLYERRVDNGLYWGLDGYYAEGTLKGKTTIGDPIKSKIFEYELEGCAGYSFCKADWKHLTFIPYGAYGYFRSYNDFKKPSPSIYKTDDCYRYAAWGVELSVRPQKNFECGIRWEVQYMTEGKGIIDDKHSNVDPKLLKDGLLHLLIGNEVQCEVDLVCRYRACWNGKIISLLLIPFYQERHLGGAMNWPINFIETHFHNVGLRCLFQCAF